MADLKLKISGTAQDSDGKDMIIDIERERLDGVITFSKRENGESLVVGSMIAGAWSVGDFVDVFRWIMQTIGKERFEDAIELMIQTMK